jgi:hypothetical protein
MLVYAHSYVAPERVGPAIEWNPLSFGALSGARWILDGVERAHVSLVQRSRWSL